MVNFKAGYLFPEQPVPEQPAAMQVAPAPISLDLPFDSSWKQWRLAMAESEKP